MSVIEQMRADLKERIDFVSNHTIELLTAVLSVEEPSSSYAIGQEIPEWQKADLDARIKAREENPGLLIPRAEAEAAIKAMIGK